MSNERSMQQRLDAIANELQGIGAADPDRFDSIRNSLSGLGTSHDRNEYTEVSYGDRLDQEWIDELYEHDSVAGRIIDRPSHDSVRAGFTVSIGDQDNRRNRADPFKKELDRLNVSQKLREGIRLARLTGGAGLLVVTEDPNPLHEPVDQSAIFGIKAIHAFDATELTPCETYTNIEHKDFGYPSMYDLTPKRPVYGGGIINPSKVHASRILRYEGRPVRPVRTEQYNGWAQPVIEAVWDALKHLSTCVQSIASATHEFKFGILKIAGFDKLLVNSEGEPSKDRLKNRLEAIMLAKSLIHAIVLDAEFEDYELRQIDFKGITEAFGVFQQMLAAATDMPLSLIFGQSPQGFSNNDETGRDNYNDKVSSIQTDYHEPNLVKLLRYMSLARNSPTGGKLPDDLSVKFHPLDEPNQLEEAQTRKTMSEAVVPLIDRGVLDPSDASQMYEGAEWSMDITKAKPDEDKQGGESFEDFDALAGASAGGEAGSKPAGEGEAAKPVDLYKVSNLLQNNAIPLTPQLVRWLAEQIGAPAPDDQAIREVVEMFNAKQGAALMKQAGASAGGGMVADALREERDALDRRRDATAEDVHDINDRSTMVAVYPPRAFAEKAHAHAGEGVEPGDLHVTLVYLGETTDEEYEVVRKAVGDAAENARPMRLGVNGSAVFPNANALVRLLIVGGVGLNEARARIYNRLERAGVLPQQNHGFIPHLTLEYHEPGEQLPDGWERAGAEQFPEWYCECVYLVRGGERELFPLGTVVEVEHDDTGRATRRTDSDNADRLAGLVRLDSLRYYETEFGKYDPPLPEDVANMPDLARRHWIELYNTALDELYDEQISPVERTIQAETAAWHAVQFGDLDRGDSVDRHAPPPRVRNDVAREYWPLWSRVFNDVWKRDSARPVDERKRNAYNKANAAVIRAQDSEG